MALFGNRQTVELQVTGMTCGHCVQHVTEALESVPGVRKASVDLESGTAVVTATDAATEALVAAVEDAGYQAAKR